MLKRNADMHQITYLVDRKPDTFLQMSSVLSDGKTDSFPFPDDGDHTMDRQILGTTDLLLVTRILP